MHISISLEKVLEPLKFLKNIYAQSFALDKYLEIFDKLIKDEVSIYESSNNSNSEYIDNLKNYKNKLLLQLNHIKDHNEQSVYDTEIQLIENRLEDLKNIK